MPTRRAENSNEFAYEKYMSSSTYADRRPIPANIVAEKAAGYPSPSDRRILFFLQALSVQLGGLLKTAADLLSMFPEIGPIAEELNYRNDQQQKFARYLASEISRTPVDFTDSVHTILREICVNPELDLDSLRKNGLLNLLERHRAQWLNKQKSKVVSTSLGKEVWGCLDQSLSLGGITVIEAPSGSGKSHSTEAWCSFHLGQAYFVTLSGITTRTNLMQRIAAALGMATCQRKASELQAKVEAFFAQTKAMLVIDEAHFLWPQSKRISSNPELIDWIDTLVNAGAHIALICTDQFARQRERVQKQTAWTSDQFIHRVRENRKLGGKPTLSDVKLVTHHLLSFGRETESGEWTRRLKSSPDKDGVDMIAGWALGTTLPLRSVRTIIEKARFLAHDRNGRDIVRLSDVTAALESHESSDLALNNEPSPGLRTAPARANGSASANPRSGQMSNFSTPHSRTSRRAIQPAGAAN